jgi:hypothetical protein
MNDLDNITDLINENTKWSGSKHLRIH